VQHYAASHDINKSVVLASISVTAEIQGSRFLSVVGKHLPNHSPMLRSPAQEFVILLVHFAFVLILLVVSLD
jgi:hypothetical protein